MKFLLILGIDVYHAEQADKVKLRCLILCWTGDLPAQCEIGKFIFCGIYPCRREKRKGMLGLRGMLSMILLKIAFYQLMVLLQIPLAQTQKY